VSAVDFCFPLSSSSDGSSNKEEFHLWSNFRVHQCNRCSVDGLNAECHSPSVAAKVVVADEISRDTPYVPGEMVVGFTAGQVAKVYTAQASALAGKVMHRW